MSRMTFPELFHGFVTILGHYHGPELVVGPHNHPYALGKVPDGLVVALREELVVQHALREGEAVPLGLPQCDLIDHGGRDDRNAGLDVIGLLLRMSVHS